MSDEVLIHDPTPEQRMELLSVCLEEAGIGINGDSTAIVPYLIPVLDNPRKIKGFVRQLSIKDAKTIDTIGISALEVSNIRLRLMLDSRMAGQRLEEIGNSAELELFRFLNRRVIDIRDNQVNLP